MISIIQVVQEMDRDVWALFFDWNPLIWEEK